MIMESKSALINNQLLICLLRRRDVGVIYKTSQAAWSAQSPLALSNPLLLGKCIKYTLPTFPRCVSIESSRARA